MKSRDKKNWKVFIILQEEMEILKYDFEEIASN